MKKIKPSPPIFMALMFGIFVLFGLLNGCNELKEPANQPMTTNAAAPVASYEWKF